MSALPGFPCCESIARLAPASPLTERLQATGVSKAEKALAHFPVHILKSIMFHYLFKQKETYVRMEGPTDGGRDRQVDKVIDACLHTHIHHTDMHDTYIR